MPQWTPPATISLFKAGLLALLAAALLYDVAIIDENNIWAVGEIMIADTSQNGYTTYNAVHWDGSGWELKRITVLLRFADNKVEQLIQLKAIFAFNENDIWIVWMEIMIRIENGVQLTNSFSLPSNVSMSINKMWGSQ